MTAPTLTPADLAEVLQTSKRQVLEWRRQYGWPSLKIGKTIRFTADHVEQIQRLHSSTPVKTGVAIRIPGQTQRSVARWAR